jgi:hypothetical protein
MGRHLVTKLPLLLILTILLFGCQDDECSCPACEENATPNSYGNYKFGEEGDDSTARCLVSKCGWHVQGGHNGGVGDTLQVASCGDEGVIFVWAFNEFSGYRVCRPDFQGEFFEPDFTQGCRIVGDFFRP